MRKIVFIDGSQCVGKTTLIEGLTNRTPVKVLKFPFADYTKLFNLSDDIRGFQLGKDLSALYFISNSDLGVDYPVVVDRGPLSTAYYSLTTGRMSLEEIDSLFKVLSGYSDKFSFVLVTAKNQKPIERIRNDGFDELKSSEIDPEKAVSVIKELADKHRVPVKFFENDFSVEISDNIRKFCRMIKEDI